MAVIGRHQVQLRPEEMLVLKIAVEKLVTDKSLSDIERALAQGVLSHLENARLIEKKESVVSRPTSRGRK